MLPIISALNGLGLALIHRINLVQDSAPPARTQLTWMTLGVVLFVLVLVGLRDHRRLQAFTYTSGFAAIVLLVMPLLPLVGRTINGSRIWIHLGPYRFQPGEVHRDAHVRPASEGQLRSKVRAMKVERIRLGEDRGVAVRAGDRDSHEVASLDLLSSECGRPRRVAIHERRGRFQPKRLFDREGDQGWIGGNRGQHVGPGQQVHQRIADHRLGRLDTTEHQYRRVCHDLVRIERVVRARQQRTLAIIRDRRREFGHRLRRCRIRRPASSDCRDRSDNRRVPPQYGGRIGVAQPERVGDDADRQRPGQRRAQVSNAISSDALNKVRGQRLDAIPETRRHLRGMKRRRERCAVPMMLPPVEGQHARPDHPCRREARVVNRERRWVPHDSNRELMRGHQPAADRLQPGDRRGRAQSRQNTRRGLTGQLVERDLEDHTPNTNYAWPCGRVARRVAIVAGC